MPIFHVGDFVRKLREGAELTQRELGAAAGVGRDTINRLERTGKASTHTMKAVAIALGWEPRTLEDAPALLAAKPVKSLAAANVVEDDTNRTGDENKTRQPAQKEAEVTSKRATDELEVASALPSSVLPDGTTEEVGVDDFAAKTFHMIKMLPHAEQEARYWQFRRLIHDPPQPAAKEGV